MYTQITNVHANKKHTLHIPKNTHTHLRVSLPQFLPQLLSQLPAAERQNREKRAGWVQDGTAAEEDCAYIILYIVLMKFHCCRMGAGRDSCRRGLCLYCIMLMESLCCRMVQDGTAAEEDCAYIV